jgi:hypothetical protein
MLRPLGRPGLLRVGGLRARAPTLSASLVHRAMRPVFAALPMSLLACAARPSSPPPVVVATPPVVAAAPEVRAPLTPTAIPCVRDEPALPAEPAAPTLPAGAPPAARALCQRAGAENTARLRGRGDIAHIAASLWCVPTTTGAWRTVLERVGETHENGVDGPQAVLRVRWVPLRGAAVTHAASITLNDAGPYWGEVHAEAAPDWDGDGQPELVLATTDHMTDEDHHVTRSVLTVRGGAITRYNPAPEHPRTVADFDGEGRLDVEVPPGFGAEYTCSLNGTMHPGPRRFARARADGTFTEDDPAARAFVRRQCAFDPSAPLLSHDDGASAMRVACARWSGVDATAVAARLRQEYPTRNVGAPDDARSDDGCFSLDTLLAEAAVAPPYVLPPRCP